MTEAETKTRKRLKKRYIIFVVLGLFCLYLNFYSLGGVPKQDWTEQGELLLKNAPTQFDCSAKKFDIYEIWGKKHIFFQSFKNCKLGPLQVEAIMKASGIEHVHFNSYKLYYDHQKLANYGFIRKCYQEWSGCWLEYLIGPIHYNLHFTFNGDQITEIKVQVVPSV